MSNGKEAKGAAAAPAAPVPEPSVRAIPLVLAKAKVSKEDSITGKEEPIYLATATLPAIPANATPEEVGAAFAQLVRDLENMVAGATLKAKLVEAPHTEYILSVKTPPVPDGETAASFVVRALRRGIVLLRQKELQEAATAKFAKPVAPGEERKKIKKVRPAIDLSTAETL